jgi:hypothetical protein
LKQVTVSQGLTAAAVLLLALTPRVVTAEAGDLRLWRALDWFQGAWFGREEGLLGKGRALRCVSELFDGRFVLLRTRSDVRSHTDASDRRRHDHWKLIARDPDSGRITLEQYESTGYRRRFELDAEASRPDRFVFRAAFLGDAVTERVGRLTLRVMAEGRFEELLELGEAPEDLRRIRRSVWTRMDSPPAACAVEVFDLPMP